MEVIGKIKKIDETKTFGTSGFRKRELVITTNEQYPQMLLIEFVQDKCDLLNSYEVGHDVKISINLRGREWQDKHFNSLELWKIEVLTAAAVAPAHVPDNPADDLPF